MPQASLQWDSKKYVNANHLLGFVGNRGNLFYDLEAKFGKLDGLYYPYSSVADIVNHVNDKTVVYSSGLWMGGVAGVDTLIAVAEYSTEFVEGNMINGSFDPQYSDVKYRVYKLYKDSLESNPNADYLQWPVNQGAPTDGSGKPLLLGDQTAWCVYNDARSEDHQNDAGGTAPMEIEVRQTVWASNETGEEDAIHVKYQIFNKGRKHLTGMYISFWADPDLGGASDDLVGCDTVLNAFFTYNATNSDSKYGSTPPAWGGRIIQGPIVPSIGDSATSFGQTVYGFRNLGMSSFNRYINGLDPSSKANTYNYMKGLARDGTPYVYNGKYLKYVSSGDPVTGTGDVDVNPSDRRLMASCGPISFNPGDSQEIVLRYATRMGTNQYESLALLKNTLKGLPDESSCDAMIAVVSDHGQLQSVRFLADSERWLTGLNFGADFFNHGCGLGKQFWGSRLDAPSMPDSFPRVDIIFSDHMKQNAYRYVGPDYNYAGYVRVPFTVWDIDRNRQLNVAVCESPTARTFNNTWNIDDSTHMGGREYIFVLASNYSGDTTPSPQYVSANIKANAPSLDILYGAWLALEQGHSMAELKHGQRLRFDAQTSNSDGPQNTIVFPPTKPGDRSSQTVRLLCQSSGLASVLPELSDTFAFRVEEHAIPTHLTPLGKVDSVQEMHNGQGIVEPPYGRNVLGRTNSTGDWKIVDEGGNRMNTYLLMDLHDWEIRFTAQGSLFYDRIFFEQAISRVPFEIWDIGPGTPDDPSDDRRMSVVVTDNNSNGAWSMSERIYAFDQPYSENQPTDLADDWTHFCRIGRITFALEPGHTAFPAVGTVIRFTTSKLLPTAPYSNVETEFFGQTGTSRASQPDDLVFDWDVIFQPSNGSAVNGVLQLKDKLSGEYRGSIDLLGQLTSNCCIGTRGNIDCDSNHDVDISDIVTLIDHLYISLRPLCCNATADITFDDQTDIVDLTFLIEHLYLSMQAVPPCP